jgi:NIF3 (NGG1p interacting factor 3)
MRRLVCGLQFSLAYAMGAAMQREELNRYRDGLLEISRFLDYCPNGPQVEGRGEIRPIVSGVKASVDLIHAAIAEGADAIVAHHGNFRKGDAPPYVCRACFGPEHRFIDVANPV